MHWLVNPAKVAERTWEILYVPRVMGTPVEISMTGGSVSGTTNGVNGGDAVRFPHWEWTSWPWITGKEHKNPTKIAICTMEFEEWPNVGDVFDLFAMVHLAFAQSRAQNLNSRLQLRLDLRVEKMSCWICNLNNLKTARSLEKKMNPILKSGSSKRETQIFRSKLLYFRNLSSSQRFGPTDQKGDSNRSDWILNRGIVWWFYFSRPRWEVSLPGVGDTSGCWIR